MSVPPKKEQLVGVGVGVKVTVEVRVNVRVKVLVGMGVGIGPLGVMTIGLQDHIRNGPNKKNKIAAIRFILT